MTALAWDQVGERFYQTGVDRGVLYLKDGTAVAWNGLTSVEEGSDVERKSFYLDGVKFLESVTPGDFIGKLQAFTYPEEFDQVIGVTPIANGLSFYEQPPKSFNLSYRTKIGNDLEGDDYGYKIHLLYNLMALPDSHTFESIKGPSAPGEFSWVLTGTPPIIEGLRPTVHLSINSNNTLPGVIEELEDILYGTAETIPRFPSVNEVRAMFGAFGVLVITDNGDGTWTATDANDDYVTMINATTFQIDDANVTYLDANTYQISSTNV